jgi:hypothetical protein
MCKRVVQRMLRHQLLMAWNMFVDTVRGTQHNRETVRKVLLRMQHRQLAGAFDCYAGAVDTLVAQREKVAKVKEASMVEAKQSIQALEEDVGRKEAEIASLQAAWDKTKQKAGEYAGHLNQGKAAPQFGTLSEMTIQFQSLKENVRRKEAEIASLQAAWDKAMQEAAVHASRLKDEVECVQENLIGMVCELKTLDEQASLDEKLLSKSQKIVEDLMSEKKSLLQSLSGKEESLKELKQNIAEAEAKRRIKACKRIVQRLLSHQLLMAWNMFVDTVRKMHHNRETMRKVLSLMQIRLLACAFDCYARAVNNVLAQRVKVAKTMAVWRTPGLKRAWGAWTEYLEIIQDDREQEKSLKQEIALKSSELQHRDHDLVSLRAELEHSQKSHEKTINESAKYISILEYELETNKSKLAQVERVRVRHVLQQHQAAAMAFCAWAEVVVVKLARQEEESIESEISRLSAALKDTRKVLFSSEGSLEKARTELKDKRKALLLSQGLLEKAHIDVASLSKELAVRKRMIEKMSDKESILLRQLEATNKQLAAICRPSDERVAALERAHQEVEGQMREQRAVSEKQLLTCLLDLDEARSALRAMHTAICDESTVQVQAGIGIALGPATVSERKGVVVTQLAKSGPAAQSGKIKVGDLLVELDGRDVSKFDVDQVKEIIKGGVGLPLRFKAQRPNSSSQYEVILERNSGSGSSASMSDTHSIPSSAAGSSPGQFTSPGKARSAGSSQFVSPGKVSVSSQVGENWLLRAGLGIESPRYRILAKTGAIPR